MLNLILMQENSSNFNTNLKPIDMFSKKILIIDEPLIAYSIKSNLLKEGFETVFIALTENQALEVIKSCTPDIILSDIDLGPNNPSGIDLVTKIKSNYHIPVIYITAHASKEIIDQAKVTDPAGFVSKPVSITHLMSVLNIAFYKDDLEIKLRKEREKRERMRLISESNPHLIMRFGQDGEIYYVNPVIRRITGKLPEDYYKRKLTDAEMSEELKFFFNDLIERAREKRRKVFNEGILPTFMGDRHVEVTVIPEFDNDKNFTSALMILNDITDQKIILEDVQIRNKRFSDSVNYSQRIQSAIMPEEDLLKKYFSDAFMFNNPKDVVSGDFPWFYTIDNYCYLACVDCTGHGIPGAFMSIIIHFLLNNIVKGSEPHSPAYILDVLHLFLQRELKQHYTNSSTKDGADISLCRIDLNTKKTEYAGAYRPLIHISENNLKVYKGDRLNIGGERKNKKQKRFKDQILQLAQGDLLCFFSDGITDQFGNGGAGSEEKFGGSRLKEELMSNKDKPLVELSESLKNKLFMWRGENKQTDDMLMIGVKI